jgi:hypothetical protein
VDIQAEQLQILQEINASLKQQRELLTAISEGAGSQAAAFRNVTEAAQDAVPAVNDMAGSMSSAGEELEKTSGMWSTFTGKIKDFVGEGVWEKFTTPFSEGLALLGTNFTSLHDIIMNPVQAAFGVLSTMYDTLIKKAVEMAQKLYELAEAYEKVRAKVGSFTETSAARVKTMATTMGSSLKEAAGGANVFASKFAPGIDGSIDRVEKAMEVFEDMGAITDALGSEFNEASDELYLLKEGLGFSSEAMQQTATLAIATGRSTKSLSQEILSSVDKIGRNFGISTKVLGKDVGAALNNFKLLGKMTGNYVKEMTQAAVFTRKLGIEITELTGLVDKFDDFEQGAEAAASLAQGFGMVLDPLKLRNMEGAADRLQELQRAFAATGRSIDEMSRVDRKLLADTAGLTEKQVSLAFSSQGLAMSYDEIVAGADAANKKQKSTEETFKDLADNIENVITPFKEFTGFMSAFFEGFGRGFFGSKGVLKTIGDLAKKMIDVAVIGQRVGRIFSAVLFKNDDGQAFLGLFTKIGTMFEEIATSVESFITKVKEGDVVGGVKELLGGVFTSISKAFTEGVGNFSFMDMAARFGQFMLDVLVGGVEWLVDSIPRWIDNLTKMFTDDGESGVTGGIQSAFKKSVDRLKVALPKLLDQLPDLGGAIIDAIMRMFEQYPWATAIAGIFVGGGPIMSTITEIANMFFGETGKIFDAVGEAVSTGGAVGAASGAAADVASGLSSGIESPIADTLTTGKGMMERLFDIIEDPLRIATMAAAVGVAIKTIGGAIAELMASLMEPLPDKTYSFVDLIAESAKKLENVGIGDLLALGGILAVFGIAVAGAMFGISKMHEKMGTMGLVGAAAATWVASKLGVAEGTKGVLTSVLEGIGDVIKQLVEPFSDETFKTNLTYAAGMTSQIGSLQQIATTLQGVINSVSAIDAAIPKDWAGTIDTEGMFDAIATAFTLLKGDGKRMGLIGQLNLMGDASAAAGKGEQIGKLGAAVTGIGAIITTLAGLGDTKEATRRLQDLTGTTGEEGTTGFLSRVLALSGWFADYLNYGVAGDSAKSIGGLNVALTSIGTTITTLIGIGDVDDANKKMLDLTGGTGMVAQLGVFATQFNEKFKDNSITDETKDTVQNMSKAIDALKTIITSLEGLTDVNTVIPNLTSLTSAQTLADMPGGFIALLGQFGFWVGQSFGADFGISSEMINNIKNMKDAVKEIQPLNEAIKGITDLAYNIEDVVKGLSEDRMTQFEERLTALVGHTMNINEILADLETVRLDATIDRLEKNMRVAKTSLSVAGGTVNVNVQLNVTMNAQKISESLIMGGYVAATDNFKKFMQNNDGINDIFENDTSIGYNKTKDGDTWNPPKPK